MSETIDETLAKWEQKTGQKLPSFTVCGCKGIVVTTEDGKKHFEIECKSKEDREQVAAIFEEEAVLRINPKVILEDTPPIESPPVAAAPVTES